ncbi:archeo-eukaryotic exosomal RNAse [Cryptosporidium canis]|uniref:Archeo-eukaryotic exosomal RNAse n=1 Tax=Cryptosporidium canis TaxID=195482 RepID=A0ABQ8PBC3_9CRYT|nr:archeo-eukaryotic exosomal RNAse [Cryptosporidium canis]KAJ1612206.1 archeo-eukaryotic exosomal RNAse [Cryptosporidium canis]
MNEIVNRHGFRQDGRRLTDIRRLKCIVSEGAQRGVDGNIYFEQGQNKLIVSIIGPIPAPNSIINSSTGSGAIVNCNFRVTPFSTQDRRRRGKNDRFCLESGVMISKTFSQVICEQSSRSQIMINITVLESDGSIRSAAINATSIALAVSGISMRDLIVSATCGLYGEKVLYDLTQSEVDSLKGTLFMAINSTDDEISPVTIDLNTKLNPEAIEALMTETFSACKQFSVQIRDFLRKYACNKYQSIYSK